MRSLIIAILLVPCLAISAAAQVEAPRLVVVADEACPLAVESARVTASADGRGVVVTYTIRNLQKKSAEELVLTAAVVSLEGQSRAITMRPVPANLDSQAVREYVVRFEDLEPGSSEFLAVGIQAVRWNRKSEWRAALPVARRADLRAGS